MVRTSQFGPRRTFIKTTGSNLTESNYFTLSGLNYYAPDELMKDNESPYARNFRIFKDDSLDSRVSVSKRDGQAFYSVPIGETNRFAQTSTTGAADQAITIISYRAKKFTVSAAGRLTKVSLNLKNNNAGIAPLLVSIYTSVSGAPGALLAQSSILGSSITSTYAYVTAEFLEAPIVALTTDYWIVVGQQSEGTGDYKWSSTTNATTALTSPDAGNTWVATVYDLDCNVFVSTDKAIKAIYRYYTTTGSPVTLFVHDTVLYSVNDATGATTSVGTGLNATATDYRFITVEDIVYFVNGVDVPQKYNGTAMSAVGGSPHVGIDICLHKNLIFILGLENDVIWSIEDNTSYEVFEADAIQYIPSPKSGDKAFAMVPFQDNLVFFTRNTKWVLYGYDRATFQLRESTSSKGAVGINAIWKEESVIYFVSDDKDVYAYNGGTDKSIGTKVSRLFENVADLSKVRVIVHDGKLRIYYAPTGQSALQNCLLYDLMFEQWMLDTEIWAGVPAVFNTQSDTNTLVHGSSVVGRLVYAESGTSDLGKPILFDYWTKYYSFKSPSRKHRIKRLYPFFLPGDGPYYCDVQIDSDGLNTPVSNLVSQETNSDTWGGGGTWGSGLIWDGDIVEPTRISVPGQARKHQIRFVQHGVDNKVRILGFALYYVMRRPI